MLGAGTLWFYLQVVNVLSQFNMVACSNWSIEHSTKRYHKIVKHEDSSYYVKIKEAHALKFIPTADRLNALESDQNADG